jgi:hypothetical protein
MRYDMVKTENFFIRANVTQAGSVFVQQEIDLGSYVNLGVSSSTLLRIHAIEVQIQDLSNPFAGPYANGSTLNIGWDLTTAAQSTLVPLSNNSVIASGRYMVAEDTTIVMDSVSKDMMPQTFRNGYLIGVDSIYLSSQADQVSTAGSYEISVLLEVTMEKATQANAASLALSQQS